MNSQDAGWCAAVVFTLLTTGVLAQPTDEQAPPVELFDYLAEYIESADGRLIDPLRLSDVPPPVPDLSDGEPHGGPQ